MIALYHGKSMVSRAIRLLNWSDYSHAAWVDPVTGHVWESWGKGVTCSQDLGSAHLAGTKVDLFHVSATREQRLRILDFMTAQIGKKYDYRGVFHFITRRPAQARDQDRWFCSELVFEAFRAAGIHLLCRIPAWKVYPGLLAYSPLLAHARTVHTSDPLPGGTGSRPSVKRTLEGLPVAFSSLKERHA